MSRRNIYFLKDANENLNIDIILPNEAEVNKKIKWHVGYSNKMAI